MLQAGEQGLIAGVAAALAGVDAEASWTAALEVLGQFGIEAVNHDAAEAWLALERGDRRVAFTRGGSLVAQDRETLSHLLLAGLSRAAEQDERRRIQERMELLSAASFEGIFVHENGVVTDANARFAELVGYEPREVLGPYTMPRCVAPEDLPGVRQRVLEHFEGTYVITGVRKDGSRFRAELQSKQCKLGPRAVRVVAVRDVTERERQSALLRESEARLRDLAGQAFDLIVFSRDGIALDVTGPLESLLGIPRQDWVGRHLVEFVAPPSVPLVTQLFAEKRTGTYEVSLLHASGEYVPVEIVAMMTTLDGEPIRLGAVRDLRPARRLEHERRRLEEQLQRGQRLESLGVLAGGVAHDFNNLLVGVLGNAELLSESLRSGEDRELCAAIVGAAQRAADLTAQLLAYAGRRDLGPRQAVDLGPLWRELGSLLSARLSQRATLDLRLEPGSVVLGDRATLTQMLMNLLTNASDALEDQSGTILVTTSRVREPDARWDNALGTPVGPGDWVLIEVRDTGVGMDSSTLLRVFEPFFSTKPHGHGLGLASCLGIVAAHGGALSVESEPGKGSCFSVLLPASPRAASEAPNAEADAAPRPRRVLVVDDESVVRTLLRRSLERRGYTVIEADGGRAGLRALRESLPDLVVLDMSMPDIDGAEVIRQVRADGLGLPILLTSGNVDPTAERRLAPDSFQGFLRKPFSMAELLRAIENALAPRASLRP